MAKDRIVTIVNKSSSGPRKYETVIYVDGTTSCNCPGWCFKRDGKDRSCKHTVAALVQIQQLKRVA